MRFLAIPLVVLLAAALCIGFVGSRTVAGYSYRIGGLIALVLIVLAFIDQL